MITESALTTQETTMVAPQGLMFAPGRGQAALLAVCIGVVLFITGCAKQESANSDESIPFQLERGDLERLLRFYMGSYVGESGGDPVASGVLEERENSWFLRHPSQWQNADSLLFELYRDGLSQGEISKDLIDQFLEDTYYAARSAPKSIDKWRDPLGDWTNEEQWLVMDVKGSMSPFVRRVSISRASVLSALERAADSQSPILYPNGTAVIAEHLSDGVLVETTIMQKRSDGYWDYFAYDALGNLTQGVRKKDGDEMVVPFQCTGCHFGTRQFEPERSFPGRVQDGPDGPRFIEVEEGLRNADVVTALKEHARRSDSLLGLYATIYLSEVAQKLMRGEATQEEISIAGKFGIERS